jgi:hypothetical protein
MNDSDESLDSVQYQFPAIKEINDMLVRGINCIDTGINGRCKKLQLSGDSIRG